MKHETGRPVIDPIAYDYPTNDLISNRVLFSFPQLVPDGFEISHLPKEAIPFSCQVIQIFILSLMQKQRAKLNHTTECLEDVELLLLESLG